MFYNINMSSYIYDLSLSAYKWWGSTKAPVENEKGEETILEVPQTNPDNSLNHPTLSNDSDLINYVKLQSRYERLNEQMNRFFDTKDFDVAFSRFGKIQSKITKLLKKIEPLPKVKEVEHLQVSLLQLQKLVLDTLKALQIKKIPLSGLTNPHYNCWANSVLQFIFQVPLLSEQILNGSQQSPLKILQNKYQSAIDRGQTIAPNVDSSIFRKWVSESVEGISNDDQEDAADGLFQVLDFYQFIPQIEQTILNTGSTTVQPLCVIQLTLTHEENSFDRLLRNYFDSVNEEGMQIFKKMKKLPEDLFIQAKRFTQSGEKINFDLDIPDFYPFPHEHVKNGKGALYECVGCVVHLGETLARGHYITVIKKEGQWYEANDDKVIAISEKEALNHLRQGYLFNFRIAD